MRGNQIDSAGNFFDIAIMLNARSGKRKYESMLMASAHDGIQGNG
jgi:hypothetical protein